MLKHYVQLMKKDRANKLHKVATFYVTDLHPGVVRVDPEFDSFLENILREGIIDHKYARPGRLYYDDGILFLENLKYNFKFGPMSATEVMSETSHI